MRWTETKKKALLQVLAEIHPEAGRKRTELDHENPYQLIVAVILSAQCTDDRVNIVTPGLFARFPDFPALAAADITELESCIQSCGLYHNKAANLKAMAASVVQRGGSLPQNIKDLTALPGVGRKTANVVLAVLWDIPALAIDTHVGRVATRLGLSNGKNPGQIEQDMMAQFPPEKWNLIHRLFIWHGRKICAARNPACRECPVAGNCLYCQTAGAGTPGK